MHILLIENIKFNCLYVLLAISLSIFQHVQLLTSRDAGGWFGGGLAGSTIDNDYTPAKAQYENQPIPSTKQQIFDNYTANGAPPGIQNALHFIWIGQNDLKKHTNW